MFWKIVGVIVVIIVVLLLIKIMTMPRHEDEYGLVGNLRRIKRACCSKKGGYGI